MARHVQDSGETLTVELLIASSDGASGTLVDGSRVLVLRTAGCDRCPVCRDGTDNLCASPISAGERWTAAMEVDRRLVLLLPAEITHEEGALVPLAAQVLRVLRRCAGEGGGPAGIVAESALRALALKIAGSIRLETVPAEADSGLTRVAHLSAQPRSMEQALQALGRMGVVFTASVGRPSALSIPDYYHHMIIHESSIVGTGRPSRADLLGAIELISTGSMRHELAACASINDVPLPTLAIPMAGPGFPIEVYRLR